MATIEGLKNWFFTQENPVSWRIYRGSPNGKSADGGSATADSPEQAWEKLQAHLENEDWEPGEYVTIRVYKNGKVNGPGSDVPFRPIQKVNTGGWRSGISGINQNNESYIAQQVSKEIEIYDLRRQVEDLQGELEGRQNVMERIINQVVEHPNFDPNAIVNGIGALFGNLFPKRAQVGVMGFDPAGAAAAPHTSDEQAEADRITSALQRLQAHFPEQSIGEVLTKLADFVDNNPVVAKNVLQNLFK